MTEAMTIGTLAKKAGVGVETIRFYEREKLLQKPERTAGNYRAYAPAALSRLNFIRQAKNLGFTLDEIRRLLRMSENAASARGSPSWAMAKRARYPGSPEMVNQVCSVRTSAPAWRVASGAPVARARSA